MRIWIEKLKNTLLKAADYSELGKKNRKQRQGNVAFMVMFFYLCYRESCYR